MQISLSLSSGQTRSPQRPNPAISAQPTSRRTPPAFSLCLTSLSAPDGLARAFLPLHGDFLSPPPGMLAPSMSAHLLSLTQLSSASLGAVPASQGYIRASLCSASPGAFPQLLSDLDECAWVHSASVSLSTGHNCAPSPTR